MRPKGVRALGNEPGQTGRSGLAASGAMAGRRCLGLSGEWMGLWGRSEADGRSDQERKDEVMTAELMTARGILQRNPEATGWEPQTEEPGPLT